MELCADQLLLRALILLSACLLLGLGIAMTTVTAAGATRLVRLEVEKATDLLKAPTMVTWANLQWLFGAVFSAGCATIFVGAVAICAGSGRRRVHSAAGALGAGAAAALYLAWLLGKARARTSRIVKSLEKSLVRYFDAFRQTGDEKFLSQIHLQTGCCGLDKGPADFAEWQRPLPSSCCGQFTGNCSLAKARTDPCRRAVQLMAGSDGLFGLSYFVWLLGVNCAVLCGLQLLLAITGGSHSIEMLVKLRQKAQSKWRKGDPLARGRSAGGGKAWQRPRPKLLDDSRQMGQRERELHRALQRSTAASTRGGGRRNSDKLQLQRLLDEDLRRQRKAAAAGTDLERKLAREMEAEKFREKDRLMQLGETQQQQQQLLQKQRQKQSTPTPVNEKLRKEAEIEAKRMQRVLDEEAQRKERKG